MFYALRNLFALIGFIAVVIAIVFAVKIAPMKQAFDEFITNQRTLAPEKNPFSSSAVQDRYFAIFDTTPINSIILSYCFKLLWEVIWNNKL